MIFLVAASATIIALVLSNDEEVGAQRPVSSRVDPSTAPAAHAGGWRSRDAELRVLVLYDRVKGGPQEKLGLSYAIMLRNLLGHFNARMELLPVADYRPGSMDGHDATFYLGTSHDAPLPAGFLRDAARTRKPLVWFKYNLWKLGPDGGRAPTEFRGLRFVGIRAFDARPSAADPRPGFFDTVTYKALAFRKFYRYDTNTGSAQADPDVGIVRITDPLNAQVVVTITNHKTAEQAPYVARSGAFWYVADAPFSFIGPRDRYVVFADLLHDILGVDHGHDQRAMIRLEDLHAMVNPASIRRVVDFLHGKSVPFSMTVIPRYRDPSGIYNQGVPQDIDLLRARSLRRSLDYAVQRGGEIVAHGYTHQYGNVRNPLTGVSGEDYEFWDSVNNRPLPEDSSAWALSRLRAAAEEFEANGYSPVAWTTPHYHASPLSSRAVPQVFPTTYQRVVYFTSDTPVLDAQLPARDFAAWQFFPYVIHRDHYGQRVIPENLGNVQYMVDGTVTSAALGYTADDVILNARYARVVRDGYASFFFHPFLLDARGVDGWQELTNAVEGITKLGFVWTSPVRSEKH